MTLPPDSDDPRWTRRAHVLLGALTLTRLVWLWLVPVNLIGDEAYYWDWGRRPAWGYFSKPPMIAWLNTLTGWLGATTSSTVRLPAVVLGMIGLAALWRLARRMWGPRAGFWALALAALAPGNLALNFLLTIDAPLLSAWAVALLALWRALEPADPSGAVAGLVGHAPHRRTGWWLLYVVAVAFGVLSKQMMLVFPLLAAVFVWTSPADHIWRKRTELYIWLAAPLFALTPVLAWNAVRGWPTLHHMAHHFEAPPLTLASGLKFAAEFAASQPGVAGPVAFVMLGAAAWSWRTARGDRRQWYAWIFSVPLLLTIFVVSGRQRVHANWPAVCYLGGMLLVVGWLADGWPRRARWWRAGWVSGAALTGLIGVFTILIEPLEEHGVELGVTARLAGWDEFGQAVGELKAAEEKTGGPVAVIVVGPDGPRQWTSELAFYLPGQPEVWRWMPSGEDPDSQYALWPGPLATHRGGRALLLLPTGVVPSVELTRGFARVRRLKTGIPVHIGAGRENAADCWLGEDLRGWTDTR